MSTSAMKPQASDRKEKRRRREGSCTETRSRGLTRPLHSRKPQLSSSSSLQAGGDLGRTGREPGTHVGEGVPDQDQGVPNQLHTEALLYLLARRARAHSPAAERVEIGDEIRGDAEPAVRVPLPARQPTQSARRSTALERPGDAEIFWMVRALSVRLTEYRTRSSSESVNSPYSIPTKPFLSRRRGCPVASSLSIPRYRRGEAHWRGGGVRAGERGSLVSSPAGLWSTVWSPPRRASGPQSGLLPDGPLVHSLVSTPAGLWSTVADWFSCTTSMQTPTSWENVPLGCGLEKDYLFEG
ncbi:LOW QUALITY PROTEIN: hypothetical protein CRUP_011618 [Coryphaenoides rupestris]|nr:LOW QUALITY PROTEIN: hypothetical protein CRUP_011618 [Coryphaenoides rupestris]